MSALIVEVDGAGVHGTPSARGRDAVRDRALRRLGYRVLHVTEAELDAPDASRARCGKRSSVADLFRISTHIRQARDG